MLDVRTRQRIDTARDILVGKVPDPKSQVEQITLALMYKFMDDMDAQSEGFGGNASFFVGEFGRYSWRKVVGRGIGAFDALNLYSEGITRMGENPGLPMLFRSIFNNAYLPFRDPETLRAFLGVIDEFEYDNSERLGDAFEYLLSIMGSQGDAGQFRTPRHIIDFIVEIVDPKKDDVILDPACGTAGFLISAYKHVVGGGNYMDGGDGRDGVALSGEARSNGEAVLSGVERERLARNVRGYDISPDMVRLSLVNLYLHGFPDPDIFEYDALTSEERWSEYANVILANPPFMSPKGGIRPHNRFSVTSKRSEVLFVDYIAEHLTPDGRAGVIVPEGIIFQSQNAYKQLRKMLVEDYLVAVVSLPPGVFNPYSGVKTSVLILDRSLARRSTTIGFFKVEADGFDLGAQRREIDRNDLPAVKGEVVEYLRWVRDGDRVEEYSPEHGLVVEKERVGADGDYNLSGERYADSIAVASKFPYVDVERILQRSKQTVSPATLNGSVTYIGLENLEPHTGRLVGQFVEDEPTSIKSSKNVFGSGDILYGKLRPNLNKVWFADRDGICSSDIFVIQPKNGDAEPKFYEHVFRSKQFNDEALKRLSGAQLPRINWQSLAGIEVPLPPLEVQREIVSEIEGYQRVIDGARAVVENWRPRIAVDPEWPVSPIGQVCKLINGRAFKPDDWEPADDGGLPIVRIQNLNNPESDFNYYSGVVREKFLIDQGQLLFSWSGSRETSFGAHIWSGGRAILNQHIFKVEFDSSKYIDLYLHHALNLAVTDVKQNLHGGVGLVHITKGNLEKIRIPTPNLQKQREIAKEIETERRLVDSNSRLIELLETKVAALVNRAWQG